MSVIKKLVSLSLSLGLFPRTIFRPPAYQKEQCANPLGAQKMLPASFSVLSWNIQYAASRKYQFFYDNGPAVHAETHVVDQTIDQIAKFVRAHPTDIIALQEVDRNSKRSGYRDQLVQFRREFPHFSAAKATYFRSSFVPIPLKNPLGRVHTDLCTLSTAQVNSASRYQLALLNESKFRQSFNLKRAILETEYSTPKGRLYVANTHLSAFSFNDGTLAKQVQQLEDWIQSRPKNSHWIVMGDFNLIPIDDNPQRLLTPDHYVAAEQNPLKALIPKYKNVFPNTPKNRTYTPFGHESPDRKIDYILYSENIILEDSTVFSDVVLSDHQPLQARFRLK